MTTAAYFLLFITLILLILVFIFIILYKKNSHTELYSKGMINENDGRYDLALDKYQNALLGARKGIGDNNFRTMVAQRIKILQATMEYEKNFHPCRGE